MSAKDQLGVAEFGYETCRGNPPVVALYLDGVGTGALPLRKHHPCDQQRQQLLNEIENVSDAMVEEILNFCLFLKQRR